MNIEELYKYAYVKKPLNEIYSEISSVPLEFIFEWFKDSYDYKRIHSDEELKDGLSLTPDQIMEWLEGAIVFTWEAKRKKYEKSKNSG